MENNIYNTFVEVIEKLKMDENVKSIIHVGSSKNKIYEDSNSINDIDLFIIVEKQEANQIRKIKNINNIEFDLNFISIEGSRHFIEEKTYFFLKIKDGNILYDENNIGRGILSLCEEKYKEGPDKIPLEDKQFQVNQLLSDISRLSNKDIYEEFEYDFLIYMYLYNIIKTYYIINDIWVPKDKKLLKSLKNQNIELYKLICDVKGKNKYEKLIKVTDYAFGNL